MDLANFTNENLSVLAHLKDKMEIDMARSLTNTRENPFSPLRFHQKEPTKLLCIGEGKIQKKPKKIVTSISKKVQSINFMRRRKKIRKKVKGILSVEGKGINYGYV